MRERNQGYDDAGKIIPKRYIVCDKLIRGIDLYVTRVHLTYIIQPSSHLKVASIKVSRERSFRGEINNPKHNPLNITLTTVHYQ
jgi:hypothetical protein